MRAFTRRHVVAGLGALAMPSVARAETRALRLRRGMNLWPWFSLTREFPAPRTDYDWPPFQPDRAIPVRGDLVALRSAGIDFVRLPVDPGPLLAFSGAQRERLFSDILGAIELANDEALSVIVNLHPNGATHHYNPRNLVGDVTAPLFTRYLGLVRDIAARLARLDPARIAFEPLNEPPQSCGAADWSVMQPELLRTARAAAPNLTLVATGACGGMIAGLEALDLARIGDPNLVYTFHFYEPYVFSHQGAPWMSGEPIYRYLNAVPWPASAGAKQKTLAAVAARMAADAKTPAADKREVAATIDRVLDEYFNANPDKRFIERYFARVTAWADRHRIARERVLLGEFGALRSDERYVAAPAADRARYVRDVRETCEAAGMPWAFWNLFDGMGLTVDDWSRAFDPAIVAALGLRGARG
jgi:endoglucanase